MRLAWVLPQTMPVSCVLKCSKRSVSPSPSRKCPWAWASVAPLVPKCTLKGFTLVALRQTADDDPAGNRLKAVRLRIGKRKSDS